MSLVNLCRFEGGVYGAMGIYGESCRFYMFPDTAKYYW
jgi:hypothetical protein